MLTTKRSQIGTTSYATSARPKCCEIQFNLAVGATSWLWWICCCPGQAWQPPCKACARTVGVWGCWPGHWLFFMELVPQRDAATLVPIIQRLILPGSTVWSDEWAAYNQLNAYVVYIRYSLHMHNVVWSVVYIINLLHFTQGCVYNIGVLYICAVSSLQFLVLPVARVPSTRAILDVWRNQCD